jgi:methyl-accepting chemotaxis protein
MFIWRSRSGVYRRAVSILMGFIAATIAIEYVAAAFLKLRPLEFALLQLTLLVVAAVSASAIARKVCASIQSLCHSFLSGDNSEEIAASDGVHDEIESLQTLINTHVLDTETMAREMARVGNELAMVSAKLTAISENQAHESAEAASSVAQVSASIQELASTARQIAENANHLKTISIQTLEAAREGHTSVSSTIEAIRNVKIATDAFSQRVEMLKEKMGEINKVGDIIGEIADQTRVLALNAAIEAARAGEAGKGFAVVATEVRKLAESVVESARTISLSIAEVMSYFTEVSSAFMTEAATVEEGEKRAAEAGAVLERIVSLNEETASSVALIQTALQQEESATEQVAATVKHIAGTIDKTAADSRQISILVEEIIKATVALRAAARKHAVENRRTEDAVETAAS